MKYLYTAFLLYLFTFPVYGIAAELRFIAPETAKVNEEVIVEVVLDADGETVNALEGRIRIDGEDFHISGVYYGDSIVPIWATRPEASSDVEVSSIYFRGMVPGGFIGIREHTSEYYAPGEVMTIVVRPRSAGSISFSGESLTVLRHDGKGTEAPSSVEAKTITIGDGDGESTDTILTSDHTAPEITEIKIVNEPEFFEGFPVLIVDARDNETGILYYEVKVADADSFTKIQSPHPLTALRDGDRIVVKVTDKAGNVTERTLEYSREDVKKDEDDSLEVPQNQPYLIAGVVLMVLLVMIFIVRGRRRR